MSDGFAIATSGLAAASHRAATAAHNLVNARSGSPAAAPYEGHMPQQSVQQSVGTGGVRALSQPVDPAYVQGTGPDGGSVLYPNVNETAEIVRLQDAGRSYEASASLIRTHDEMSRTLIDVVG